MSSPNTAKFTFLYLLSLVGLGFFAVSSGVIIFQIINKHIVDVVEAYSTGYSSDALRFALASLIVAAPIYLLTMRQIQKNLFSGAFAAEAGIRKWLTYLIVLIAAFVMLGWGIGVIYNFLNGELTLKFILKALTVLIVSGAIFHYYLHDIKRDDFKGKADSLNRVYAYGAAVLAIIIFIAGIVFVESPAEARRLRQDAETLNRVQTVRMGLVNYYEEAQALPATLDELTKNTRFIVSERDLTNPVTNEQFAYKGVSDTEYELCTVFATSNKDGRDASSYGYYNDLWEHDAGEQCVTWAVTSLKEPGLMMPVR